MMVLRLRAVVVISIVTVFLAGCMKRDLSEREISEDFLKGLSPRDFQSFNYAFEGNHAGYSAFFKIVAPRETLKKIIFGADDWGLQEASYAYEGVSLWSEREPNALNGAKWFDLKSKDRVQVYRQFGINSFTTSYLHFYFVDWEKNTMWIEAGGT